MKAFKCDLCNEGLDSKRQAFKHFDKVHAGAGTMSPCIPVIDADHFDTTPAVGSASASNYSEDGDEVKVKKEPGWEETFIIPNDPEDLAAMDVGDNDPAPEARDPLSLVGFEEDGQSSHPEPSSSKIRASRRVAAIDRKIMFRTVPFPGRRNPSSVKFKGHPCPKCGEDFQFTKDMLAHYRMAHTKDADGTCTSPVSPLEGHRWRRSRHRVLEVVELVDPSDISDSEKDEEPNSPPECEGYDLVEEEDGSAEDKVPTSRFKCKLCDEKFSTPLQYRRHYNSTHLNKAKYPCDLCRAGYSKKSALRSHQRRVHWPGQRLQRKTMKSEEQDKGKHDGDSDKQYEHDLSNQDKLQCACDLCKLGYNCASILKEGKPVSLEEGEYPCDICGRQFDSDGKLGEHRGKVHPGVRLFCGEGCGEHFALRRKLLHHQQSCPVYQASCGEP